MNTRNDRANLLKAGLGPPIEGRPVPTPEDREKGRELCKSAGLHRTHDPEHPLWYPSGCNCGAIAQLLVDTREAGFRDGQDNVVEEANLLRKTPFWVNAGDIVDMFITGLHVQVLLKRDPSRIKKCTYCGGPVDAGGAGLDPATPTSDEECCTYCGAAIDGEMQYRPTKEVDR